jgi:hypothetical protein
LVKVFFFFFLANYKSGLSFEPQHARVKPVDQSYPVEGLLQVHDPAIFDKPFLDGRFLCNVLGCPSTFARKADRDRHVQSWHNCATLHFCPVLGCVKSLGKPYSRKDKLQEHMRKKHATPAQAVAQG